LKQAFLICDAPGHGRDIHDCKNDDYPDGSPDGLKIDDLMRKFAAYNINFTIVKINEKCDLMIKVMQESYNSFNRVLGVSDLSHAVQFKSFAQVT